jgi:hypothetical protein
MFVLTERYLKVTELFEESLGARVIPSSLFTMSCANVHSLRLSLRPGLHFRKAVDGGMDVNGCKQFTIPNWPRNPTNDGS